MFTSYFLFGAILCFTISAGSQNNALKEKNNHQVVSSSDIESLTNKQFSLFLSDHINITSPEDKDLITVKKVSHSIVSAIKNFYKNQYDKNAEVNKIDWEVRLVEKKEANIWCMPGGKMAIYTGLLASTQSEASLAVLISHVMAHILLKQGNERLEDWLFPKLKAKTLSKAIAEYPKETNELFLAAFGVGTNAGVWAPYSNKQEIEADQLALQFSILAGYKPRDHIVFWSRMGYLQHSPQLPEFMSMHPTDEKRIQKMEEYLDELKEKSEKNSQKN